MNRLRTLIENIVRTYINEVGRFHNSPFPDNSRSFRTHNGGPLTGDWYGNHANQDVVSHVSTVDYNGANFVSGKHHVVSDEKYNKYKQINFGRPTLKSSLDFFGGGANGEIELRREIDRLNGAARRNQRPLMWRTIIPKSKLNLSKRSGHMLYTFWEFSLNGGQTWNILKPNAVDSMKESKFTLNEQRIRSIVNEAADAEFNVNALNNITSFAGRYRYCQEHLGKPVGRGSSRIVFQIDDDRVLKLASNKKGIAQNEVESEWYKQSYDFIPKIFNVGKDVSWIECEYVLPAKKRDFNVCLGMSFDEFCRYLYIIESQYSRSRWRYYQQEDYDKVYELGEEIPVIGEIISYMTDAQIPAGDMTRLANWGLAQRDGEPMVVLLDHGLTMDVWNNFYK